MFKKENYADFFTMKTIYNLLVMGAQQAGHAAVSGIKNGYLFVIGKYKITQRLKINEKLRSETYSKAVLILWILLTLGQE